MGKGGKGGTNGTSPSVVAATFFANANDDSAIEKSMKKMDRVGGWRAIKANSFTSHLLVERNFTCL